MRYSILLFMVLFTSFCMDSRKIELPFSESALSSYLNKVSEQKVTKIYSCICLDKDFFLSISEFKQAFDSLELIHHEYQVFSKNLMESCQLSEIRSICDDIINDNEQNKENENYFYYILYSRPTNYLFLSSALTEKNLLSKKQQDDLLTRYFRNINKINPTLFNYYIDLQSVKNYFYTPNFFLIKYHADSTEQSLGYDTTIILKYDKLEFYKPELDFEISHHF